MAGHLPSPEVPYPSVSCVSRLRAPSLTATLVDPGTRRPPPRCRPAPPRQPSGTRPIGRQELSVRPLGPAARTCCSRRLPGSAARSPCDPTWASTGPRRSRRLSTFCHRVSTPYGRPRWHSLNAEKRVTLTIHEYCSSSGAGIWFECLLMQQMPRAIYGDDPGSVARAVRPGRDRRGVPPAPPMLARTPESFGAPSIRLRRAPGPGARRCAVTGRPWPRSPDRGGQLVRSRHPAAPRRVPPRACAW
ncbi:MAG: conserved hypothetical prtoein [Blastococcus sp.]|jgi:hypothetical protein|nr:conserved hypothetical prtoein [Blastococcus sp.]